MRIIGLTGKKRSGKDTVGQMLRATFGFESYALAGPVKQIGMSVYGLTRRQVDGLDGYDREEVLPEWGCSVRHILQRIGTELGREIHEDTWVRKMVARFEQLEGGDCVGVVVTDVRFPNEAEAIRAAGGEVWRISRPSVESSGDTHASETSIDLIRPDWLIHNTGTLEDLAVRVEEALGDLEVPEVGDRLGLFDEEALRILRANLSAEEMELAESLHSDANWPEGVNISFKAPKDPANKRRFLSLGHTGKMRNYRYHVGHLLLRIGVERERLWKLKRRLAEEGIDYEEVLRA